MHLNSSPNGKSKMEVWLKRFQWATGGGHILAAVAVILYWSFQPFDAFEGRLTGAAVSLILTAVGCSILFGIPDGYVPLNAFSTLARAFPEEPWKWRDDWRRGTIKNRGRFLRFLPWFAGGYLLVLTTPSVLFHGTDLFEERPETLAMLLTGPCLGVLCLILGLYTAARWRRYGGSTLELVTNPGVTGGWLRAILHSRLRPGNGTRVLATLHCKYSTSSGEDGKNRSIWRQSRFIEGSDAYSNPVDQSQFPIEFYIPYDTLSNIKCMWELEISARVAGPNFHAIFLVPVFKTPESTPLVPPEAVESCGSEIEIPKKYHLQSRARVTPLQGGGLEVKTNTLRPMPIIIMTLAFAAYVLWTVFESILSGQMSMLSFFFTIQMVLPLSFLAICGAVWWGLGKHLVTLDAHTATIRRSALVFGRTYVIPLPEVTGIEHGPPYFSHGRPREDVTLLSGDKTYRLATGLPLGEGRWLTSVLKSYLKECAGITLPLEAQAPSPSESSPIDETAP